MNKPVYQCKLKSGTKGTTVIGSKTGLGFSSYDFGVDYDYVCGSGTKLEKDKCVPTNKNMCGPGTKLEKDRCVPAQKTVCGKGTTLKEIDSGNFSCEREERGGADAYLCVIL